MNKIERNSNSSDCNEFFVRDNDVIMSLARSFLFCLAFLSLFTVDVNQWIIGALDYLGRFNGSPADYIGCTGLGIAGVVFGYWYFHQDEIENPLVKRYAIAGLILLTVMSFIIAICSACVVFEETEGLTPFLKWTAIGISFLMAFLTPYATAFTAILAQPFVIFVVCKLLVFPVVVFTKIYTVIVLLITKIYEGFIFLIGKIFSGITGLYTGTAGWMKDLYTGAIGRVAGACSELYNEWKENRRLQKEALSKPAPAPAPASEPKKSPELEICRVTPLYYINNGSERSFNPGKHINAVTGAPESNISYRLIGANCNDRRISFTQDRATGKVDFNLPPFNPWNPEVKGSLKFEVTAN